MNQFFKQLIPFILAGIGLVAFAFGIMLLGYLLVFGILVGSVLFIISYIKNALIKSKKKPVARRPPSSGRTIDSDDWQRRE